MFREGELTSSIYQMIKNGQYSDAVKALSYQQQFHPHNRAVLSLLGYCHYYLQNFTIAADFYQLLENLFPDIEEYKIYHAQSLYHACLFDETLQVTNQIENSRHSAEVAKLQAAAKYSQDDVHGAQVALERCSDDDSDKLINQACVDFKSGEYESALDRFLSAVKHSGYTADLQYNIALCYFKLKNYTKALRYTADLIENGMKDHPELGVGMVTDGLEVHSVGNTLVLSETALVEAFNLKAAIEYVLKNYSAATEAMTDMPPRNEEELDAITLHNQALMNFDSKPSEGFAKLQFLVQQDIFPAETFRNLLLLYCKYEYYDMAADLLAENASFTYKYLDQNTFDFLDAIIIGQTSPEESFRKFEVMSTYHTEVLRKLTVEVHEMQKNQNEEGARKAVEAYDEQLEQFLPVLMAQAKIFWDAEDYERVEKIFRKSVEFCSEHSLWRLNVAHTLFMQETKFKEAAGFYEPVIKQSFDNILKVSAIVLANLCVCYIMTNQNEEAEELMRKVEKEEEKLQADNADTKVFHLCIINLVIGTLYCSKGNYEFGISRIIKAMDTSPSKLGPETWFYVKRCFLAFIENLAKHLISVSDATIDDCLQFLEQCEEYQDQATPENRKMAMDYESRSRITWEEYFYTLLRCSMVFVNSLLIILFLGSFLTMRTYKRNLSTIVSICCVHRTDA